MRSTVFKLSISHNYFQKFTFNDCLLKYLWKVDQLNKNHACSHVLYV